ncbi:hypothetical protein BO71DRAFT_252250 [Aspergillus ellipticus CBS 707.79]|uniref:Extracellular membrane protein CFEM domain-containing protein n=1 Tax=Aspergillus ellipticus CBS 707.79 TaxID=1448320 RepID=A0A319DQT4_9EURO|nr:hypothetical protein BO71DRAFT_252250 [Aspergillus ellipticus CBS 707.79]
MIYRKMRTLILLSTITLATAANQGLGYLECASSIASTYHSTECTSASTLDCFCNAPFNPSNLDQDTMDRCESEGVPAASIPDYICNDTHEPVSVRKGSQPMMRVAGKGSSQPMMRVTDNTANGTINGNATTISVTVTSNKDSDDGENGSTSNTFVNMKKNGKMDANMNANTPRAYAPDPTSVENKVHMTDASDADVVYNLVTETLTDCACKETKAPEAPDADIGVDVHATETDIPSTVDGADVPMTGAVSGSATAPATAPATGTPAATVTEVDGATTPTATELSTPSADADPTSSSARLFTISTATATSTVVASGTPGPMPSGADPTRVDNEGESGEYTPSNGHRPSSPGVSQSGNKQGNQLFEGAAGRSMPQCVGVIFAAGMVAAFMV